MCVCSSAVCVYVVDACVQILSDKTCLLFNFANLQICRTSKNVNVKTPVYLITNPMPRNYSPIFKA